jgi:hypothetical protein
MAHNDLQAPAQSRLIIWFLTAVLLIAVVLFAILVMVPSYQHKQPPASAAATATDPPAAPNTTTPPVDSSDLPADATPTTAPPGVAWQLVGQVAVPASAVAGPNRVNAGRASGYAQNPVGALIAAAQLSTRAGYSAGRSNWEPTLLQQTVASTDRDALLTFLRSANASGVPQAGPGELSQIAGFRFYSYTPAVATVGLVRRTPAGAYSITTLTVRWLDGDWKLLAPPGGSWPAVTTPLLDLGGVAAWGAS